MESWPHITMLLLLFLCQAKVNMVTRKCHNVWIGGGKPHAHVITSDKIFTNYKKERHVNDDFRSLCRSFWKWFFPFCFVFLLRKRSKYPTNKFFIFLFFNAWQKSGFLVGKKCSEKVVVGIGILKMLKVNFAFIWCVRSKLCLELLAERETSMLVTHWWKNIKNKKQFVVSKEVII